MKEIDRWIRQYDRLRTSGPGTPNEAWTSSKFDIYNMPWSEVREIYIPELQMTWGKSCEALRKSWYAYKMNRKQGMYTGDLSLRINRIQRALGIEMTEFDDIDPEWIREEPDLEEENLTPEELELKNEEMLEEAEQNFDTMRRITENFFTLPGSGSRQISG